MNHNYRRGHIVTLMCDVDLDANLQLVWMSGKSFDYYNKYSNADKLRLKKEVAAWLETTQMHPYPIYVGEPLSIQLHFEDEVDAQLFCMAWQIEQ